jgi:hypothetical protein
MTAPSLAWETFFDRDGVPHIIPMYGKGHQQPGHTLEAKCNCYAEVRKYPNKIIVVHRVIQ